MSRIYTVNMIPGGVPRTVNVSQYDNDYNVEVTLLEGQGAYSIPAGATIRVEGTKPDGLGFEYDCTYASNVVQMPIKTQMSVIAGNFPIELVVYKSGVRVGSANMVLAVEKAPLGEGTDISETDIPDIIDAAETNAERAEDAADRAEAAADTAEAAAEEVEETAIDLAPVIVSNASGSIASFPDGTNRDATRVVVNIIPSQSGSGDPSPTNVRTISGYTSVDVVIMGKNLFDLNTAAPINDSTTVTISGQTFTVKTIAGHNKTYCAFRSANFTAKSGTTYTLSGGIQKILTTASTQPSIGFRGTSDNVFVQSYSLPSGSTSGTGTVTWTPTEDTEVYISGLITRTTAGEQAEVKYSNLQLEYGATATEYNPYTTPTTTTIPLPSTAGTVYGGTLDVVNGTLTVDRAYYSFTLSNAISTAAVGTTITRYGFRLTSEEIDGTKRTQAICDILPNNTDFDLEAAHFLVNSAATFIYFYVPNGTSTSTTAHCVLPLATPTTYTLTPTQIKTLQGYNNIYSPQGSVSVDYRADTKLYIEKLTKPTEDDMVANANIASGKFFMVGNNLYISTTAITTGTTIVPGSNCTALSLADALNQINA